MCESFCSSHAVFLPITSTQHKMPEPAAHAAAARRCPSCCSQGVEGETEPVLANGEIEDALRAPLLVMADEHAAEDAAAERGAATSQGAASRPVT